MRHANPTQRPLDEEAIERWGAIEAPVLTRDGKRAIYFRADFQGRRELRIHDLDGGGETVVEDVRHAELDASGRFIVGLQGTDLVVFDCPTSRITRIAGVAEFRAAPGSIAYLRPQEAGAATLGVRHLESGRERSYADVVDHALSADGSHLLYLTGGERGVAVVVQLESGATRRILESTGRLLGAALDRSGRQAAFYVETPGAEERALHTWHGGDGPARKRTAVPKALPDGWRLVTAGPPTFSPSGRRLYFTVGPPQVAASDPAVEIWHWRDALLPSERQRMRDEGSLTYRVVLHLPRGPAVLLESEELPEVALGDDGDADFALGVGALHREASWEEPPPTDYYLVDVRDGTRRPICRAVQGELTLSPGRAFAIAWHADRAWHAIALDTMASRNLTGAIPFAVHDEDHDRPGPPGPYGRAGWLEQDRKVLLYDRYDLWALDPRGAAEPQNVTRGAGRRRKVRFRRADGRAGSVIGRSDELLLHGFDETTKATGFYRQPLGSATGPIPLLEADRELTLVAGTEGGARHLFTKSSVVEFPDLWISDGDFERARRVSTINPQQRDYVWATAELVAWTRPDGGSGRGVLYKPENFTPGTRYPLVVFAYERFSDHLHYHYTPPPLPQPVINPTVYASRGYLVLVPDVTFRVGAPGASALEAVVSGVRHLVDAGLVDERRVGAGSHSWGGYELAYIATRTALFRAIAAGAPVANMTSSYGEIRAETGRSRMFEYEQAQSRIGSTLWQAPQAYLENSPVFGADRIVTPLLILHNEDDGAVPRTEGLQLFLALRRLGKPAWLVSYPGEGHLLRDPRHRIDWDRRLRQFFDHYLMGAPAPDWLGRGSGRTVAP